MHHQEKTTGICSTNPLATLKTAIHHVSGNWLSPSQTDLFSVSLMFLSGKNCRSTWNTSDLEKKVTECVLILQFVSQVLDSYNKRSQRTSINLGDLQSLFTENLQRSKSQKK